MGTEVGRAYHRTAHLPPYPKADRLLLCNGRKPEPVGYHHVGRESRGRSPIYERGDKRQRNGLPDYHTGKDKDRKAINRSAGKICAKQKIILSQTKNRLAENDFLFLPLHIDYYPYLCHCKGVLARLGRLRLYPVNLIQVMLPKGLCLTRDIHHSIFFSPLFPVCLRSSSPSCKRFVFLLRRLTGAFFCRSFLLQNICF